jgi:hypothetical protein
VFRLVLVCVGTFCLVVAAAAGARTAWEMETARRASGRAAKPGFRASALGELCLSASLAWLGIGWATAWRPSGILFLIFIALAIILHTKARVDARRHLSGSSSQAGRT